MYTAHCTEWEQIQFHLIRVYSDVVPQGGTNVWTTSGNAYPVWYLLDGCVDIFDENGQRMVHAGVGDWVCKPPARRVYQVFSEGARIISIWFDAIHGPTGRPICNFREPFTVRHMDEPRLKECADGILELAKSNASMPERRPDHWELTMQEHFRLQARARDFVATWPELAQQHGATIVSSSHADPRVVKASRFLNGCCFTGRVPYDDLLPLVGLSRVQLDRVFLRELGITPKQYMDRQVLDKAIGLLAGDDPSIKAIAFDLGFKSPAHFCSWFRRQTGVTPGRYQAH